MPRRGRRPHVDHPRYGVRAPPPPRPNALTPLHGLTTGAGPDRGPGSGPRFSGGRPPPPRPPKEQPPHVAARKPGEETLVGAAGMIPRLTRRGSRLRRESDPDVRVPNRGGGRLGPGRQDRLMGPDWWPLM